jgi:hypothetical protein
MSDHHPVYMLRLRKYLHCLKEKDIGSNPEV